MLDEPFRPNADHLTLRGKAQEALHARAAGLARARFGRRVFVRGVVELSNYCRENCLYCGMRRDNQALHRYRLQHDALAEVLVHHRPASLTDVNIQTGEDPVGVRRDVIPLITTLRRETPLGISVCLGTLAPGLYNELQAAGATIYIMKFETAHRQFYQQMQAPGSWQERLEHIRLLARRGWHVSSGFIAGLPGQRDEDLLHNFQLAGQLPLRGCSVSPFIPGESTPLAHTPMADIELTLNCMALLRLTRPEWVIPAVSALHLAGPGSGYQRGLRTGANLVTINLTPPKLREDYLLYRRDRFIMTEERILAAIEAEGLIPSKQSLADFFHTRQCRARAEERRPALASVV